MTDDVRPEVIKKTQDLLGKYFKKPPLTEKLLRKPPFRFLHDIVSAVIRETGFLEGLFSEEELNSENIKDKEAKLAYLTKLIDVVKLISGTNLTVRASKIISGQEPTKTNELLQAIGRALDKKVSSAEAIEHYKKNQEKKSKSSSKTKSTTKEEKRAPTRHASQTRKPAEKEKPSGDRQRSSSTSKVTTNDGESREDRTADKPIEDAEETEKNNKITHIPPAEPLPEKVPASAQRRKSARSKQNALPSETSKTGNANVTSDRKAEEQTRRRESASRTKRSLPNQSVESVNHVGNAVDVESKSTSNAEGEQVLGTLEIVEQKQNAAADGESMHSMEKSEPESQKSGENEASVIEQSVTRPRTSLRPPSARPPSARPAAPRIRAKTELIVNEEISTPMGNISVIIDTSDVKEEDDAEDMVVLETRGGGDSLDNSGNYKIDNQLTQEHGHLVAQILETQRELVNTENVDVLPKKTDIAWEAGSKRDREAVAKEIDKLRGAIQTLTRATNPLGKLLDYLQEDVEMMQKELLDWRRQYHELNEQLENEKVQTRELIEPMKMSLKDIDENMKSQLDKICQAKSQIMKNDQKIQRLLNGHT